MRWGGIDDPGWIKYTKLMNEQIWDDEGYVSDEEVSDIEEVGKADEGKKEVIGDQLNCLTSNICHSRLILLKKRLGHLIMKRGN